MQEKVTPLIQGHGKVRVIIPSLALISQIMGLRFMFHQDMDSIIRDLSWFKVEDCLKRAQGAERRPLVTNCLLDGRTLIGNTIWGSGLTHISFALLKR